MKRSAQNELLRDILAENDLSALKRSSLEGGLTALRQRRQDRRKRRTLALVALLVLLSGGFLIERDLHLSALQRQHSPATPASERENSEVKLINDEELFALFPNRPLALVGKPGHQELVFLDRVGEATEKLQ